ncbi:MAG: hemerythrin domain-containing protein, partial [Rhodospirillales bacterium]|nr:hemerythrin domain-containing protein [Rhodospirillales bacterium]
MALLRWRQNMSLGNEALDADHKYLISLVNRLHYMMLAGDEVNSVQTVLDDLLHFVHYHFQREELLMRRGEYPHT